MNMIRNAAEIRSLRDATDLTDGEIKTITSYVMTIEQKRGRCNYLEVGVFAGATIRFLKQYTKTSNFVGVDLFEDFVSDTANTHTSGTFKVADIQRLTGDRSRLIKGNSHAVLPQLAGNGELFDFVFIDGNHTYAATMQDFRDASKLVEKGGLVSFHNASPHLGPDFELYITADGGPWAVCQAIMDMKEWQLVESIDRLRVFKKLV